MQSARNRFTEVSRLRVEEKKKILYVVLAKKKKTEVGTECLTDVNEVNMPGRFLAMR